MNMDSENGFNIIDTGCENILAGFGNASGSIANLKDIVNSFSPDSRFAEVEQIHSKKIITFKDDNIKKQTDYLADGMATDLAGIALIIRTADCYPVILWDSKNAVIGAIHSGREGTRKNIVSSLVKSMLDLGAKTETIKAAAGPGISEMHYEVDENTWTDFVESTGLEQKYRYIDIRKVINRQLIDSGLRETNILNLKECSYSNTKYCSFRRNKTKKRQYSFIVIRDKL